MRILLFGGSGQLGSDISRHWTTYDVTAPTSTEVNIQDESALVRAFERYAPDVVINCAAFHHVDRCEDEPGRAFAVNALAVNRLAEMCMNRDVTFVTFSTDYVFDGIKKSQYVETDSPNPLSAYGVSKLAGELLVERLQHRAFIIRVCGLYGLRISSSKGYTFIDRIIAKASARESVRVVTDQTISPTYTAHVVHALKSLLQTKHYGLYHMVNDGAVTWHEFAAEALRQAGIESEIEEITSAEFAAKARRPTYSALRNERLGSLGIAMPSWREGVAAYLADKAATDPR